MLRRLGLALLVGLAALLLYVASRPDTFRVERSASIAAAPEAIFPMIEDFHRWGPWSPYEKRDPAMKRTYSGAPSGPGAVYAWEGNRDIGKGRMEIAESSPPSRVALKLDFSEPFEAHNTVVFTLVPEGDATRVTWAMDGRNAFVSKLMGLVLDMDDMIGRDFEAGLANLKSLAEQ
jgi:Polyketide cyclase / dehydrase and lipid transport